MLTAQLKSKIKNRQRRGSNPGYADQTPNYVMALTTPPTLTTKKASKFEAQIPL